MAAGRGEFFRSLMMGLERRPPQPVPTHDTAKPGLKQAERRNNPFPGRTRKSWTDVAPSPVIGTHYSWPEGKTDKKNDYVLSSPAENLLERLPSEILIYILSYLDVSSLFCIMHVSKLFYQLASDNVIWHKIYTSEFGTSRWKLTFAHDTVAKDKPVEPDDWPTGHWKTMYFKTVAGQQLSLWKKSLSDISPYTGLPSQTRSVLRSLNVSWELSVCDCFGHGITLERSRAFFFESSVIMRWCSDRFPRCHLISNIQLHGVRRGVLMSSKHSWRSLILKMDMDTRFARPFGTDRLIELILLPGFVIGKWRGNNNVAFIMVCLHFHRLVERSLLGSPVCPLSESVDRPHVDKSDPEFGLHGYTLHFTLHTTATEIMSGHYHHLSSSKVQIQRGLVELRVVCSTNLSKHRPLSGHIQLPWKYDVLEGCVEKCCVMTLTLLDEFQKPFWCVSAPVCLVMTRKPLFPDYTGQHFVMEYKDPDGEVRMKLVWLNEQRQYLLISLSVYLSVVKVNNHFHTKY